MGIYPAPLGTLTGPKSIQRSAPPPITTVTLSSHPQPQGQTNSSLLPSAHINTWRPESCSNIPSDLLTLQQTIYPFVIFDRKQSWLCLKPTEPDQISATSPHLVQSHFWLRAEPESTDAVQAPQAGSQVDQSAPRDLSIHFSTDQGHIPDFPSFKKEAHPRGKATYFLHNPFNVRHTSQVATYTQNSKVDCIGRQSTQLRYIAGFCARLPIHYSPHACEGLPTGNRLPPQHRAYTNKTFAIRPFASDSNICIAYPHDSDLPSHNVEVRQRSLLLLAIRQHLPAINLFRHGAIIITRFCNLYISLLLDITSYVAVLINEFLYTSSTYLYAPHLLVILVTIDLDRVAIPILPQPRLII